jgi:hypothetical protein
MHYIWVTLQRSKGRSPIVHSASWHIQTLQKRNGFSRIVSFVFALENIGMTA